MEKLRNREESLLNLSTEIEKLGGTCQELPGETNQQHTIELGSYPLLLHTQSRIAFSFEAFGMEVLSISPDSLEEVRDRPVEMNQEAVKVLLECRNDIPKNKELLDLIKDYFEKSFNTLSYCDELKCVIDNVLLHTQTKLQRFDEENEGNFLFTREFIPRFADLHQQHILLVNKLQILKANLDQKQDCIHNWRKLFRFIFATLLVSVLIGSAATIAIVTSRLATALAATATSVPLASIGMWTISILNKYHNVVEGHKEIINWMKGSAQLTMHDLAIVRPHILRANSDVNEGTSEPSTEESVNIMAALIRNLKDLGGKVVDCSKSIRKARTAILRKIMKCPNHLDAEGVAFPLF